MLLAASPHSQPDAYDALSTASALHTPQQLAQLEAVARAQARETPESSLVSDDEKYLAAQLVYLASQYHGSEYNRQKANVPQGLYIPLSIQLPTHIAELRTRQATSAERQAWFVGEGDELTEDMDVPKEEDNDSTASKPEDEGSRSPKVVPGQPQAIGTQTETVHFEQTPPSYPRRPSYFQPEIVQVDLLHDALGNSLFPASTRLPHGALALLGTQPPALDPDVVETPPPLKETDLPQFPERFVLSSPRDNNMQQLPSTRLASQSQPSPSHFLRPLLPLRPAPVHVAPSPSPQLQLALETAISKDTLPRTPPSSAPPSPGLGSRAPRPPVPKTSESHPINISQVIPPDHIGAISSQLTPRFQPQGQSSSPQGTYFCINPTYRLDRVIYVLTARAFEARAAMAKYSPVPVRVKFGEGSTTGPAVFVGPGVKSEPNISKSTTPASPAPNGNMLGLGLGLQGNESPSPASTSAPGLVPPNINDDSHPRNKLPAPIVLPTLLPPPSAGLPPPPSLNASNTIISRPVLGNLYLSSCPGKKVRLNGPTSTKGRGAICRDLKADLERIKQTGVFLIVCCLDDDELEFLGSPWEEYQRYAKEVGLDVLRLPMPEGLCPLSVQTMSEHMDKIIRSYTLRGKHVLAHCRGGVGRAGLVACVWMLKLGICGSISSKQQQDPASGIRQMTDSREQVIRDPVTQAPPDHLMRERKVPRDSMELLERVVYIIRRQRSVKAIETYEQVRFLLEFIEYLRDLDAKSEMQSTS
ncbi:Dual specificity phosphatase, catalytic domain [Rhizoctonia solani]|uniref:Dual specificity phosphatase, catalytic domain n=1 Tax=Rhizoctonia solani TaxID=456999 RepID=A0A8H8NZ79_9AGAM|nr:Dual specificity phosphatase, catalytic domain [Rhizoctonia solani]QRW21603.1 Dual specificity phosphatase, catalytic domain [Rhizoctonia solani]